MRTSIEKGQWPLASSCMAAVAAAVTVHRLKVDFLPPFSHDFIKQLEKLL